MEKKLNITKMASKNVRLKTVEMLKYNFNIILYGPGGCGKNYAKDLLEKEGFIYGPSYVSRDIRDGEVHGKDYNFISREAFEIMMEKKLFIEAIEFNGNYYGTTKDQFYYSCNLFIMTPDVVNNLSKEDRENSIVIFFDIPASTLINRLKDRGDSTEQVMKRRMADIDLFSDAADYDIRITNEKFTMDDIIEGVGKMLLT